MKISIVLASFNGEKYIKQQLMSLLSQLKENDELIISDDNSTDNTVKILQSIEDSRIVIIENSLRVGYQKNFSRAIEAATGDIITFSDQDDISLPYRIQHSIDNLQSKACFCGDAILVDKNLKITSPSFFALRNAKSFSTISLLIRPKVIGATISCKTDFLRSVMPFPNHIPHDQWISIMASISNNLSVTKVPLIKYRRHENTVTSTEFTRKKSILKIVENRLRLLTEIIKFQIKK